MLIEEDSNNEPKIGEEMTDPDTLEAIFDDGDILTEEIEVDIYKEGEDDDADEIDIAFAANDEGYW